MIVAVIPENSFGFMNKLFILLFDKKAFSHDAKQVHWGLVSGTAATYRMLWLQPDGGWGMGRATAECT